MRQRGGKRRGRLLKECRMLLKQNVNVVGFVDDGRRQGGSWCWKIRKKSEIGQVKLVNGETQVSTLIEPK